MFLLPLVLIFFLGYVAERTRWLPTFPPSSISPILPSHSPPCMQCYLTPDFPFILALFGLATLPMRPGMWIPHNLFYCPSSSFCRSVNQHSHWDMCKSDLMQYFHGYSRSSYKSDSNNICRLGDTTNASQERKIKRVGLETLEMGAENNSMNFCSENIA